MKRYAVGVVYDPDKPEGRESLLVADGFIPVFDDFETAEWFSEQVKAEIMEVEV
jgi:hypothetical protein